MTLSLMLSLFMVFNSSRRDFLLVLYIMAVFFSMYAVLSFCRLLLLESRKLIIALYRHSGASLIRHNIQSYYLLVTDSCVFVLTNFSI